MAPYHNSAGAHGLHGSWTQGKLAALRLLQVSLADSSCVWLVVAERVGAWLSGTGAVAFLARLGPLDARTSMTLSDAPMRMALSKQRSPLCEQPGLEDTWDSWTFSLLTLRT